jgi:hypothetical protein
VIDIGVVFCETVCKLSRDRLRSLSRDRKWFTIVKVKGRSLESSIQRVLFAIFSPSLT